MDEQVNKLADKLDKICSDISDIKIVQAEQGKDIKDNVESLQEHMRRTANLEDRVAPLEMHVAKWAGAGKFLTFSIMIAGIVIGILKFIGV